MLKLTGFVFRFLVVGALALFAACYLNPSGGGRQEAVYSVHRLLQTATAQADSLFGDATFRLPADMQSFSATASTLMDSNVNTAKLQLKSMECSIAAAVPGFDWRPSVSTSPQEAAQDIRTDARNLAHRMPELSAFRSNMDRLSDLRPAQGAAHGF